MKKLTVSLALVLALTACGGVESPPTAPTEKASASATGLSPEHSPDIATTSPTLPASPTLTESDLPSGPSTPTQGEQCENESFSTSEAKERISRGHEAIENSIGQSNHLDIINEFYDEVDAFDNDSPAGCLGDTNLSFYRVSIANLKADVREGWDATESYAREEEDYQKLMHSWR